MQFLKENIRIWCKLERTKDSVRLHLVIILMTNFQERSATAHSTHDPFMGCSAWFLHARCPEDSYSTVGRWVKEQQEKVDKAKAMLQQQCKEKNKHRLPASYQQGDRVLVQHSSPPAWPRSTSDDPTLGRVRSCPWTATASLCCVLPD